MYTDVNLQDTNSVTVRRPSNASTDMYNMPIQLYSTPVNTRIYKFLGHQLCHCKRPIQPLHLKNVAIRSHVCKQMYSTQLQIHVHVYRNICKHQFCHCVTPIEYLHVKNVATCKCTCICPCVWIQLYDTNTHLQTSTGHQLCLSLRDTHPCLCLQLHSTHVYRHQPAGHKLCHCEIHIEHLNV